jgi:hypothetical protein
VYVRPGHRRLREGSGRQLVPDLVDLHLYVHWGIMQYWVRCDFSTSASTDDTSATVSRRFDLLARHLNDPSSST